MWRILPWAVARRGIITDRGDANPSFRSERVQVVPVQNPALTLKVRRGFMVAFD